MKKKNRLDYLVDLGLRNPPILIYKVSSAGKPFTNALESKIAWIAELD